MIKRNLANVLSSKKVPLSKAVVIFGARRVGKTTLLRDLIQGGNTTWINGDILREAQLIDLKSQSEIDAFLNQADTIVIDEAQQIPSIGLKVKILADANELRQNKVRIFVTGSSSLELAGGIHESAVGRFKGFNLWPLSFKELIDYKGALEAYRDLPLRLLYGMYPAVVTDPESAVDTLRDYCQGILFSDIYSLIGIHKPKPFVALTQYLAASIGSEISYDSLARKTGLNKAKVIDYIDLLEKCFIIRQCNSYARNMTKEIRKGKKIYFCDLGIRNGLLNKFEPLNVRDDVGALWENFFFMERVKYHDYRNSNTNFYFWREAGNQPKEIDFLEETNGKLEAFECKYSSSKTAALPKSFFGAYGDIPFHTITPQTIWPFIADGCPVPTKQVPF